LERTYDKLLSKFSGLGYVSRKLVKYSVVKTVKTAYYGYVYGRLKYLVLAWGYSYKGYIDGVFKNQK